MTVMGLVIPAEADPVAFVGSGLTDLLLLVAPHLTLSRLREGMFVVATR